MVKASKRASKSSNNNGLDRLSALPDAILCHILSFLDTKYAVATSVLSTRWKNICFAVPNIIFDHSLDLRKRTKKFESDFASFALRQMMLLNVTYIDQFRLHCKFNFKDPLVQTLVRGAIWRNVKELDIRSRESPTRDVKFPPEVFTSKSLVVFKLKGSCFEIDVPNLVHLPNLKVLVLEGITLGSDRDSVKRLFDGCKVLEELSFSFCSILSYLDVVDLSIPSLRKLAIEDCRVRNSKFIVDMPNLEVFEYGGREVEFQVVNELKFVSRAEISFDSLEDRNNLYKLMNKMLGVKCLHLSSKVIKALHSSSHPLLFEDLTCLKLDVRKLEALPSILRTTPKLEVLIINIFETYGYGRDTKIEDSCSYPKVMSACLGKHLKNIEFKCSLSRESEFELVKYFLLNGKVLKKMKIEILGRLRAQDLLAASNRIFKFPKSSKNCEIIFVSE